MDNKDTSEYTKDSNGKGKSFRRLIVRFAEKTSMQGVPYINMAKLWWAKAIWSVLLLGAMGVMFLHLWYLFDQWYSFPKSTNIELGFDSLPLPQITICNTNIMHKGRLENYNGAEKLRQLLHDLQPDNLVPDDVTTPPPTQPNVRKKRQLGSYDSLNISDYVDDVNTDTAEDDDFKGETDEFTLLQQAVTDLYMALSKKERNTLGHQISDMLVSCTFSGRKCSAKMFRLHQTAEYGNCWTITSRGFKVRSAGPTGGLSIVLNLETSAYLKGLTTGFGTRVVVQELNTYPFPQHEGVHIPASMETDIGLKMKSVNRLGDKYGSCSDGDAFMKAHNLTYTRRACQAFCSVTTIINTCSCFDDHSEEFALTRNATLRPCRSKEERQCLSRMRRIINRQELSCECDKPCSEISYRKTISMRQWPSEEYTKILVDSVCKKNTSTTVCDNLSNMRALSINFLKLNVYYEDLNYENITETPQIELQQFLSDIGGAFGLWIGLSVLSFCELLQLFVELIDYLLNRSKTSGRHHHRHNKSEDRSDSRDSECRKHDGSHDKEHHSHDNRNNDPAHNHNGFSNIRPFVSHDHHDKHPHGHRDLHEFEPRESPRDIPRDHLRHHGAHGDKHGAHKEHTHQWYR